MFSDQLAEQLPVPFELIVSFPGILSIGKNGPTLVMVRDDSLSGRPADVCEGDERTRLG